MCEVCVNNNSLIVNRNKSYDPTHTTTLRNTMVRASNRRFDELIRVIRKAVDADDCFGLKETPATLQLSSPGNRAFQFGTSEQKVSEFLTWLNEQVKKGLLTVEEIQQVGESIYPIWTNKFISDSYRRGVKRARQEMINAGHAVPTIEAVGGIGFAMTPIHIERAGLMYARVYSELKGITLQMEQIIGRILAQGMIDGENPRRLARKLVAAINGTGAGDLGLTDTLGRFIPARRRAEIMARTEIIRAHHLGTIQEYRNWGVAGVEILAELATAGDERVCPICSSLEGRTFTLDEAEGVIPVHPQCRCIMLPKVVKKGGK
jgi:SPP1 gp7 family putative phage head morphogenesis protein